jgi:hypothetical protein
VLAVVRTYRRRRAGSWAAALPALLLALAGCGTLTATDPAAGSSSVPGTSSSVAATGAGAAPAAGGSALAALSAVDVKGRAPRTGYDRDQFGAGWVDTDHNGCDTRNDVLARDLTGETFKPQTHDCVVLTGTLADPYSGRAIQFRRGQDTSEAVQIDHVVALSDAWQKGAQQWPADLRTQFANDPLNLLAVDGPLNQQKSDGDAATWLPPNHGFRCAYVSRQLSVKLTYHLWMTQAEHDAIASILGGCPDEPLPTVATRPAFQTAAEPAQPPPSAPPPTVPAGVTYRNCAEVRAAGAAPIHAGDPGWSDAFDRDGDGVGCE